MDIPNKITLLLISKYNSHKNFSETITEYSRDTVSLVEKY